MQANEAERKAALVLSKSLKVAKDMLDDGCKDATKICRAVSDFINEEPLAKIDYVKIVDALTMQQVENIEGEVLVALAVYVGKTRLIDNIMF